MTNGPPSKPPPLFPTLARSDEELRKTFRTLQTVADVSALLEVRESQLTYLLWRKPENKRYHTWEIRKRRGGTRIIDAPTKTHRILQNKLAYIFALVAQQRSAAHGFVHGKSIVTNASAHTRCRWVLNLDLQDFFPSIHFGRVRGMLLGKPYLLGERAATAMAQLCCHKKRLPQGAPTSPIVSNMICAKLDGELRRLAEVNKCKYTRYADDLTFSTREKMFPTDLAALNGAGTKTSAGTVLRQVIEANGFQINPDKSRLQSWNTRQEVTGLVVNRRPNVRRAFVSQIRAMLHAWEKYGYDAAQDAFLADYDTKHRPQGASSRVFEKVIRGKLAFLKQVRGSDNNRYISLRRRFGYLTGEVLIVPPEGIAMEFDAFICHASEDKITVVEPLRKALKASGIRVWVDTLEIKWGDSVTGGINDGLVKSRFVILVLSTSFLAKKWPVKEMNAVLSREISSGVTCALPLIVGNHTDKRKILGTYPLLSDKHYKEWAPSDVGAIVGTLKSMLTNTK